MAAANSRWEARSLSAKAKTFSMISDVAGSWSANGSGGRSGIRFLLVSAQVRTALTTASWPCLTVSSTWSSSEVIMSVAVAMGVLLATRETFSSVLLQRILPSCLVCQAPGAANLSYPKTYFPGAASTGGWAALPIRGAECIAPARSPIQAVQSSHHDPLCSVAPPSQALGSAGLAVFVQWIALGLGGLTIPAMWPDDDSVKRTFPGRSWVVL